jgi:2-polyprenyl-3-methyl-5-hydroxy-6-metoxy-1,4-benzoquinol methylase
MDGAMSDKSELLRSALEFRAALQAAQNFDEILPLWRNTSLPYSMGCLDPFSEAYRLEVLDLYKHLTDAVYSELNELTSNKQETEQFEIGYPWVLRNLDVIAVELAKAVQALRALHRLGLEGSKIVEFGAGWGNLAIPLAKAGQNVVAVDIDKGFLSRIERIAAKENVAISTVHAEFVEAARGMAKDVDAAIFQASFHHCLNFQELLGAIRDQVLSPTGVILFLSEPIHRNFEFPWGLRFDGESLWAIMCNKWLELGFDHAFFSQCLLRAGFFLTELEGVAGFVGSAWAGVPAARPLAFEAWSLPALYDETFWSGSEGYGRFCRPGSRLPGLEGGSRTKYALTFRNFSPRKLRVKIKGRATLTVMLEPDDAASVMVDANCPEVVITSDVYVPAMLQGNGDNRTVGAGLISVTCV